MILPLLRGPLGLRLVCIACALAGVALIAGLWSAAPRAAALTQRAPAPSRAPTVHPAAGGFSPLDRSDESAAAEPDGARRLNAEIPLSAAPVEPARPFRMPVGGSDRERALECLTTAIYYEAGFEPVEGRRAVAQVVLNRLRHPAFPKTVCGVVFEGAAQPGCQFSFACDGSLARQPEPAAYRRARRIAEEALDGRVEPSVGGATHYHADYVAPYWRRSLDKVRQIGAHIFYRWRGEAGLRAAFVGRYLGHEPPPLAAPQVKANFAEAAGVRPAAGPEDVGGKVIPGLGWTPNVTAPSGADSAYERLLAQQRGGEQEAKSAPAGAPGVAAS